MRVYVASSWRNIERHREVVKAVREAGHEVYDFTDPENGKPFSWSEIHPDWQSWSAEDVVAALQHPRAVEGFANDMGALKAADACVLVMPCGRSAHLELGYAVGASKRTVVLLDSRLDVPEAELMWGMADRVVINVAAVVAALDATHDELVQSANDAHKQANAAWGRVIERRKSLPPLRALGVGERFGHGNPFARDEGRLAFSSNTMERIKAYRLRTGSSLHDAKEAVLANRDLTGGVSDG